MRITNEPTPVVARAGARTQETAGGDTFAALLAAAGLVAGASAGPADGAVTGDTTAEALAAMGVLVPTLAGTGLPVGATATTAPDGGNVPASSPANPMAPAPLSAGAAATALGLDAAALAETVRAATAGATTATSGADVPDFDMGRLDITVEVGTAATPDLRPTTSGAGVTVPGLPATGIPATGETATAPEHVSADAADAAGVTGSATNATGPLPGPRAAVASAAMADRPIPPSRLSDVALAAARASSEADRPVKLTVRLDPPNLGEVRVELVARNGSVTVRVEPVHDAAAPLLAHQRDAVAAALERTGLSLSSFDVTPGEPERRQAPQSKRTVRIAELTATDEANTDEPTAGRTGLRI
jgi:flagellar hook-length control protein FliK